MHYFAQEKGAESSESLLRSHTTAATHNPLATHTRTIPRDPIRRSIQLRNLPKQMASDHDSPAHVSISFRAIVFAPLIVVGLLVLLASWLAILSLFSWLSSKFQEYRARRRIDDALAPIEENDMVETRHVENGMWQLSWKTRQVANMEQGPQRDRGAESNTEDLWVSDDAFIEGWAYWVIDA